MGTSPPLLYSLYLSSFLLFEQACVDAVANIEVESYSQGDNHSEDEGSQERDSSVTGAGLVSQGRNDNGKQGEGDCENSEKRQKRHEDGEQDEVKFFGELSNVL